MLPDEIHEQKVDVRIYSGRQTLGKDAAGEVAQKINDLLAWQETVNIVFAAAPSQNEFLTALTESSNVNWAKVNAFHMDEYIGLNADASQLFAAFLKERLFSKLPFNSVNYINGNTTDIQEECRRYSALLESHVPDIVCMGIGENGHLAFNDPPVADFKDKHTVKEVSLDLACRQQQVNDGCFESLDQVPSHAITLTVPALMNAPFIYCIVPGITKARAVYNTLNSEITEKVPASVIRTHPAVILFLDKESSSLLWQL